MTEPVPGFDTETHRRLAITLFNQTWAHIDDQAPAMLRTAYASLYHWSQAGGAVEEHRGEWLVSRVWCLQNEAGPALRHARTAWEIGEAAGWNAGAGFADFDRPFGLEALARAHACAGDLDAALAARRQAQEAGQAIAEREDREYFLADLAGGNWFGLGELVEP